MIARWRLAMVVVLGWLMGPMAVHADVKPHGLISEGAVLQQQAKVRIWGTADAGERVSVTFRNQDAVVEADKDGRWSVQLDSKDAGGPFPMTIQGKNKIELKNVLVGEVWVCSGQSNMQWTINACDATDKEAARGGAANPALRMFTVARNPQDAPAADVKGSWVEAGPETVADFSAVGYFFGRDLQGKLKVPVGIINSSWGGTRAEAWTSRKALESNSVQKATVDAHLAALKNYPTALEKHKTDAEKAKAEGKPAPKPPVHPAANPNSPSVLYNGMIHPLLPYAIKGAIWYQGESNVGKAYEYRTLFPMMIKNWREDWGHGDFPFLFVQLAPFLRVNDDPIESAWAELREAQLLTLKLPNTGMAVITDYGHEADIHPTPKRPVGERLALVARATVYGERTEYSGPVVAGIKVEGDKVILRFTHLAGALESRALISTGERKDKEGKGLGFAWRAKPDSTGAPLRGFTIAGDDRKFYNANAKIDGDRVIVWSEQVAKPVAVRYGWANHPLGNLFNKEGLPTSPFRTDDFPITTQPKK